MDEKKIREIVRDEMERNSRSGSPVVPPHQHNGKDNLRVNVGNLVGTNPVPFGSNQFSTIFLANDYGYASPQKLGANKFVLNNLDQNFDFAANNLISTVPIPVIYGYGSATFTGGNAQIGTMVAFQNFDTDAYEFWIMLADGWYGTTLLIL